MPDEKQEAKEIPVEAKQRPRAPQHCHASLRQIEI